MGFQATESLAEQIARHLGQMIISGQLLPKARIQEAKVASDLKVGRGSVREALLLLEKRQLIDIVPRKGAVVSELTTHRVEALFDIYINLLVMLVSKLAVIWKDGDLEPMLSQAQHVKTRTPDSQSAAENLIEAGFNIMSAGLAIVNNPYLEQVLNNFRPAISRTYHLAIRCHRYEFTESMHFYSEVLQFVQKRDSASAKVVIEAFGEHQKVLLCRALNDLENNEVQCA